ncbi:MAG: DUF3592 domain-containing protein [bacterium]
MMMAIAIILGSLIVGLLVGRVVGKRLSFRKRSRWLLVALITLGLGLLLTLLDSGTLQRKWAERSWPSVTGEVVSTELVHGNAYAPLITYKYEVGDSTYTATSDGRAPGFGGKRRRYDAAEAIIHEYAPGSEILVHYNPANPSESTLRPGPNWDVFAQLSFGSMLMMLGVALLVLLRQRPAPQ